MVGGLWQTSMNSSRAVDLLAHMQSLSWPKWLRHTFKYSLKMVKKEKNEHLVKAWSKYLLTNLCFNIEEMAIRPTPTPENIATLCSVILYLQKINVLEYKHWKQKSSFCHTKPKFCLPHSNQTLHLIHPHFSFKGYRSCECSVLGSTLSQGDFAHASWCIYHT